MLQSETLGALAPALSWMFLPPLLTTAFLQGLYQTQILTPPSTPAQSQKYKQRAQAFVSVAYFAYTIYAAFQQNTGQDNFYRVLQVDVESDAEAVRRNFRKLARIYHPDKVGTSRHAEAFFLELRKAHDTLVNPTRRWMYDRLGSVVLAWNETSVTQRELLHAGIRGIAQAYLTALALFAATGWLFRGDALISFWSIVSALLFFSMEYSLLLTSESRPFIVQWLLPSHTIHDVAVALRQTHAAIIMAAGHIRPHLPVSRNAFAAVGGLNYERKPADMRRDMAGIRDGMAQQLAQTAEVHQQASRALDMALFPLRPEPKASAETVQDAAARAAAAHRQDKTAREPRSPDIKPSAEEETFMHLMSKAIYRARLLEIAGPSQEQRGQEGTIAPSS